MAPTRAASLLRSDAIDRLCKWRGLGETARPVFVTMVGSVRSGVDFGFHIVLRNAAALLGLVGIAILWIGVFLIQSTEREQVLRGASQEMSNLCRAFEEQIQRTIESTDQTLLYMRDAYRRDPVGFDVAAWSRSTSALTNQTVQIGIIDRNGLLGASNYPTTRPGQVMDLSDREHFLVHRNGKGDTLFISKPVIGRASKKWSIQMSRRLDAADGSFDGVIVVSIDPEYLSRFYKSVDLGVEGIVFLVRIDGTVLAGAGASAPRGKDQGHLGSGESLVGQSLAGEALLTAVSEAKSGTIGPSNEIGGIDRLYAYRRLSSYPLIVAVGMGQNALLTEYFGRRDYRFVEAGLISVVLLVVTGLIVVRQRRLVQARDDLRVSALLLEATLAHMSQGIMMVDGDGRVPVCNPQAIEMLGLTAELMARQPLFHEVVTHQRQCREFGSDDVVLDAAWMSQWKTGERHSYERCRPDGTILEVISVPLEAGGMVRTYTDVSATRERERALQSALSERDKAEAALRRHRDDLEMEVADRTRALAESEARHRDVAEVASDWFWETDAHHSVTFLSERFGEVAGIAADRLVGRPYDEWALAGFDPDDMRTQRRTTDVRLPFRDFIQRVNLPDRGLRFWRLSGKPFFDTASGVFSGYRGTGTDVTAKIEQEAALASALLRAEDAERDARRARASLLDAIEAIPEGFVLHDADDRLVLCNTRYAETYHLPAELSAPGILFEDALRANAAFGNDPNSGMDDEEWVASRLVEHRACSGARYEHMLANGRWMQAREVRTSDGGIVGIRTDVTETRQREASERDREKLAALGHLAGGVAHEINNLIQPALVLPEMVRDRLPLDDIESREDLDCVTDGARQVRDIVRNILLFARKEDPRLVALDLVVELRAALGFVRNLLPTSVTVCHEGLDSLAGIQVAANKTQLTQVLTNLMVNAAQAMKDKGIVTVTVAQTHATAELARELTIEPGRSYVAVSVADTGSGMSEATRARVFEPFFTTKPIGQGTGLGLSVVYGILRSWQGAIALRSTLGEGTTFVLYVPLIADCGSVCI